MLSDTQNFDFFPIFELFINNKETFEKSEKIDYFRWNN